MGIASWLLAGLLVGLGAPRIQAGGPPGGCFGNLVLGVGGALLGGALATHLRFGGLLSFDWRSLVTAFLAALLAVLLGRLLRRPG